MIVSLLMLTTNPTCNTALHHLIAEAIEVCGGSRKLIRILNRLGVCVSGDTHDRFVTSVAEEQRKLDVWNELSSNVFTVASADNIDFLKSHAAVYCGNQSRSYHGTTIQLVQPIPLLIANDVCDSTTLNEITNNIPLLSKRPLDLFSITVTSQIW